jgi:hypothetical protein
VARDEDGDDGQEVVFEFVCVVPDRVVLNHDLAPGPAQDVADELEREAAESVAVGNHNFFDVAAQSGVQNGEETMAFPVDARRDVRDDFVVRVFFLERFDLAVEVGTLLLARHSGVADPPPSSSRGRLREAGGDVTADDFGEIGLSVQPLPSAVLFPTNTNASNLPCLSPVLQGGVADGVASPDLFAADVPVAFIASAHPPPPPPVEVSWLAGPPNFVISNPVPRKTKYKHCRTCQIRKPAKHFPEWHGLLFVWIC